MARDAGLVVAGAALGGLGVGLIALGIHFFGSKFKRDEKYKRTPDEVLQELRRISLELGDSMQRQTVAYNSELEAARREVHKALEEAGAIRAQLSRYDDIIASVRGNDSHLKALSASALEDLHRKLSAAAARVASASGKPAAAVPKLPMPPSTPSPSATPATPRIVSPASQSLPPPATTPTTPAMPSIPPVTANGSPQQSLTTPRAPVPPRSGASFTAGMNGSNGHSNGHSNGYANGHSNGHGNGNGHGYVYSIGASYANGNGHSVPLTPRSQSLAMHVDTWDCQVCQQGRSKVHRRELRPCGHHVCVACAERVVKGGHCHVCKRPVDEATHVFGSLDILNGNSPGIAV